MDNAVIHSQIFPSGKITAHAQAVTDSLGNLIASSYSNVPVSTLIILSSPKSVGKLKINDFGSGLACVVENKVFYKAS